MKINILGRTGPRSIKGKANSSMNALKHGGFSPRPLLHFEDAGERKRLERQMYRDIKPRDCLEETLTDQMIQSLWQAERFKLRLSLRQESVFQDLTPIALADMLDIPEPYRAHAPQYLKEPNTKISKREVKMAAKLFQDYLHLCKHSKGIANYQMVFSSYQDLFIGLDQYLGNRLNVPIIASTGNGLSIPWQQETKKLEEVLEEYAAHLYYQVHFEQLRPQIRVWMSAWFFLQRRDQRDYQIQDEHVVKELNRYQATLMQLLKYRKAQSDVLLSLGLEKVANARNEIPNSDSKSAT
jgi:hypothetical protein